MHHFNSDKLTTVTTTGAEADPALLADIIPKCDK